MNYLCLLLPLLDNLGCGSGIKASFMPLTLHEISASLSPIPCASEDRVAVSLVVRLRIIMLIYV